MKRWTWVLLLGCSSTKNVWGWLWTPQTWQEWEPYQIPVYPNAKTFSDTIQVLEKKSPLVFAGECRRLTDMLGMASCGKAFVLTGGDCAETFRDFSVDKIRDDFRLLLRMALLVMYAAGTPVIPIGRVAGQFGKPRSMDWETDDNTGLSLPVYRGDIINGVEFNEISRTPDPGRMLEAYHQSAQTLNLLRAFLQGGMTNVECLHTLNQEFVRREEEKNDSPPQVLEEYQRFLLEFERSFRFVKACLPQKDLVLRDFFTGHECILLPYESALCREDSITGRPYGCSAHFLWLGERTRKRDAAQVEFLRGIDNPIGIKLSHQTQIPELLDILEVLDPERKPGRLTLITRMGDHLGDTLPEIIDQVRGAGHPVVWCCDPMHGNTRTLDKKQKTRFLTDIRNEIIEFFRIHEEKGTFVGGIHLEMTSSDVAECVGGGLSPIDTRDVSSDRYESTCDPRLNGIQAIEIAFLLASLLTRQTTSDSFVNHVS